MLFAEVSKLLHFQQEAFLKKPALLSCVAMHEFECVGMFGQMKSRETIISQSTSLTAPMVAWNVSVFFLFLKLFQIVPARSSNFSLMPSFTPV